MVLALVLSIAVSSAAAYFAALVNWRLSNCIHQLVALREEMEDLSVEVAKICEHIDLTDHGSDTEE